MELQIYVVTMYRWGNRENHSYVEYVGDSENAAVKAGENEASRRGGKYDYEIDMFILNSHTSIKIKRLSEWLAGIQKNIAITWKDITGM